MTLIENIRMAINSIKAHRLRSILTMIGIIIGVASVIVVVSIGKGGEELLKSQIIGKGNILELFYQPDQEYSDEFIQSPFTGEDIKLLQEIRGVNRVVASNTDFGTLKYREKELEASIISINQSYFEVKDHPITSGTRFSSIDYISGNRVVLISDKAKEELFGEETAIGEVINLNSQPMRIIGILKKPTGLLSMDNVEVYLPLSTSKSALGKSDINQVSLEVKEKEDLGEIGEIAANKLNAYHHVEDHYQVINLEQISDGLGNITRVMTIVIGSIAGISLFVGGVGVMNIMLVSVTERTREIGIRKALGATRNQIMIQFLIESVTLTLIGGSIGIAAGFGTAKLISLIAGWPSLILWEVVFGGLAFSVFIGLIFGLLPANKASKLDPIEALRYE
ncbi:ABC transporter permease [Bacillus sp. Marseille-Q1617]|uniref:ABC transporter permease n=1 Tax=Bacillus sp. Marseille-Q1617 TaxID=2736887 RepID=UPI001588BD93|nr:ABC transporter permease [Bacillus sp. Marseille-Q1617]